MPQDNNATGLLIFRNLTVQNANTISSPLTWGFPSMTAFLGLMWALERKVSSERKDIIFNEVGVVCHKFAAQISSDSFEKRFSLTRNPLTKTGETRPISEEGRAHLRLSIVFSVSGEICRKSIDEQRKSATQIGNILESMRVAGGTIIGGSRSNSRSEFILLEEDNERRRLQFRKLRRRFLPGAVLVLRDDLLQERLRELKSEDEHATLIDAWLDLSRIAYKAKMVHKNEDSSDIPIEWTNNKKAGWIVPIPVGYAALSELYPPGSVANSRDETTPFRFVESLYSVGEWISPHRLSSVEQMLWTHESQTDIGLYRCTNNYTNLTT